MIISVGIDIIEVYRIRGTIERTPRFVEKVFTEGERNYCESKGAAAAQSFAGRFAAKEAFLKALKTGWNRKIKLHDIEIQNDENGVPFLKVKGEAERLLNEFGVNRTHISISHTSKYATAQVIFERCV